MPRGIRPKLASNLVSEEILNEIKSFRPLRLFINKQKKKGNMDNPFILRAKFYQLPLEKQSRFLQKAVDKYIELLDENDVDEHVQIECKLFEYLLLKSEQKKYFQSINAPMKPPGSTIPYYTQVVKQESYDDNEAEWGSLSIAEKQSYKKMSKEAKAGYSAQVRNFANDLPDRLQTDYLLFTGLSPHQANNTLSDNSYDNTPQSQPIRQRRKPLAALPESLQTTNKDIQPKLTKPQLRIIHNSMPNVLYYETGVSDGEKPTFTKAMTKNSYIRSLFNELNEKEKLKYILQSIKKWNEFLSSNPNIIENQIPTLHLLLSNRNDDILLYYSSIGLPPRPPVNSYLLYNHEKYETNSEQSWSDLSQIRRNEYSQQLIELKTEYYEKLIEFVDHTLPSDHLRYEFFRNVKYAIKDYELATKGEIIDKDTGQFKLTEYYIKQMAKNNDVNQFNIIKERLLSTRLTHEQKDLIEQLSQLLYKYVE